MLNSLNLCPGGPNDDLSADRSDTHFHTSISVFTQCACQELIQLGVENTWCSKMMLLQDDVKMWRWITMGIILPNKQFFEGTHLKESMKEDHVCRRNDAIHCCMYIATNFCFIMFPPMCAILVQAPSATNFRFLETCDWLMASVNNADLSRNVPAKFMQFPLAQG